MSEPNELVVAHKLRGVVIINELDAKIAEHNKAIAELESAKRQFLADAASYSGDYPE